MHRFESSASCVQSAQRVRTGALNIPNIPPCPLSQATTIGGGPPPSIMGSLCQHLRLARSSVYSGWLGSHWYLVYAPPKPSTYPSTHTTPSHATTLHHTLTHSTQHVSTLYKIVSKYFSQSIIHTRLTAAWALSSMNPQPWRFTNNSLGLPHAPSLSVCLFLWVCVVCVCFLLCLSF